MKDGLIRVGAACPPITVGDPAKNAIALAAAAKEAAACGVRVLVFPELSLTAYTCGDLFFSERLLDAAEAALSAYIQETAALDMLSFVGLPVAHGGRLYNCAAAVCGGRLLGLVPKTHLPSHGEFAEGRHFAPAPSANIALRFAEHEILLGTHQIFSCREMKSLRIACEICEDLWVSVPPSCAHTAVGATLIVNPSASDEVIGAAEHRRKLAEVQSARTLSSYIFSAAGAGESGTDLIFAGHGMVLQNGRLLSERKPFDDATLTYAEVDLAFCEGERRRTTTFTAASDPRYANIDFSLSLCTTPLSRRPARMPFVPDDPTELAARCELIFRIAAEGLCGRTVRAHAKKLVLGISGGLDSTLALLTACRAFDALGRDRRDILAITMPCFGTTARTKGNAEALCEELGVSLSTVDIHEAVRLHFRDIGQDENCHDAVYENAQARERTQILMDVANAEGGLVVGTGDLSELALGWATYNGDHMSMYGVNAGIPKTLIRHLVSHAADMAAGAGQARVAEVLCDILDTPVSPELLPPSNDGAIAQQTESIVGPYELHDFFLFYLLRCGFTPKKILRLARAAFADVYPDAEILAWLRVFLRRFFTQQFKRSCLPDGPKVGSVGLSPRGDLRMPSDASPAAWLSELDGAEEEL